LTNPDALVRQGTERMMIAKCDQCHVVFTWNGPLKLRDARCPVHGTPVTRTTYLSQWPRSRQPIAMTQSALVRLIAEQHDNT